jgi:anti-repressor protein
LTGSPWFYAADVCRALAIGNPSQALVRLDADDLSSTEGIDAMRRKQTYKVVNESGLYDLVFQSRTAEAKKFKRWVTKEVLPQIRKTGGFGRPTGIPAFVRRFNDNWIGLSQGTSP